jgi:hypothetical protein
MSRRRHGTAVNFPRLVPLLICTAMVAGCGGQVRLEYPMFDTKHVGERTRTCDEVDHYLQQVDAVRWSMREDGAELETDFEQMVEVTLATAAAIVAVPAMVLGANPTFAIDAYSAALAGAPEKLERADALLIALLAKRRELQCPPHPRCAIAGDDYDTLDSLRKIRSAIESGEMREAQGIEELTRLLDGLCPVGTGKAPYRPVSVERPKPGIQANPSQRDPDE